MILLNLVQNLALLVALAAAHQVLLVRRPEWRRRRELASGLLFGAVALVGMMTPVVLAPGLIFDGRSIILSTAGLFGGPLVALVAAVPCAAYRLWLGGPGAVMGVCVIAESAALGALFHFWRARRARPAGWVWYWGFSLLVHLVMLGFTFLLPVGARPTVWHQLGLAIVVVYPLAGLLVCLLFADYEKQRQSQATLETSERRLDSTLRSIGDAVIATDTAGRVERMNPVAEALTGWKETEARGQPLREVFNIVNEETRQPVEDPVSRVLREGRVVGLANHTLLLARDGREIPIADAGAPIRDDRGQITGVVLVFRDQSAERRAQRAVAEARAFAEGIIATLREPLLVLDARLQVVTANRSFCQTFQVTPEETVGRPFYELGNRQWDIPKLRELLEQILPQNTRFDDFEVTRDFERIGRRTLLLNARCLYREANKTRMLLLAFEDITERKRAEAALRESERNYREIFNATNEAIFLDDAATGRMLDVNEAMLRMYGYANKAEVLAGNIGDLSANEPPYTEAEAQRRIRLAIEEGPQTFEWLARKRDGTRFWVEVSLRSTAIGGQGRVLAVVRDITERKQAEEALRLRHERLQRENSMLYQLTASGAWLRSDLNKAVAEIVELAADLLDTERVSVWWYNDDLSAIECMDAYSRSARRHESGERLHSADFPTCYNSHKHGQVIKALDVRTEPRTREIPEAYWQKYDIRSLMDAPIWVQGRLRGILCFESVGQPRAWTQDEERLAITLATFVAACAEAVERKRAEAALRESEAKFRTLAEEALVGVYLIQDDRFVYVNPAAADIPGYSREELLALPSLMTLVVEADRPRVAENLRRRLAGETKALHYEFTVCRKDGQLRRVEVLGAVTTFAGRPAVLGTALDVTERRRAEAALRESEERFRRLFENSLVGIYRTTPDGRFLLANPTLVRLLGYDSFDELARVNLDTEGFHSEYPRQHFKDLMERQGVVRGLESAWRRADGRTVYIRESAQAVRDASGRILYYDGVVEDITERKQAAEERARLAIAIEQAAEAVIVTDPAGTILYVNPAFEKITGYSRAEVLGRNPRLLKSGKHDDALYQNLWATLTRGQVWRGQFINRKKDGTLYEEEKTISPVRDAAGRIQHYVAVGRDVTREAQLEAQLRQAQKMEAIGQLAGGVAHDFNNILAAMILQVELTAMTPGLPEEAREGLREIRAAADRAASLTRQLLLFGRRQVMQPVELDLNEVVTNLAKMLQRIIGEDVRLHLHLHPTPLWTRADSGMLGQVLMNLAVNARDALPRGGWLRIETTWQEVDTTFTRRQPEAVPGRYVCLRVSDNGCGIAPEVLPRIFEPFFTTKEQGKGTGLGLATVFGIVKQHGGWVDVASTVGQGTTFEVYLPALPPPPARKETLVPTAAPRGTETILLVEDELAVRQITRHVLERYGYRVLEAASGVEALERWEAEADRIDLLLTDLVMPGGLSGGELAARFRARHPRMRVLFTTGYSPELAGRELELQPGQNLLQKPAEPMQLLAAVRRCLDD